MWLLVFFVRLVYLVLVAAVADSFLPVWLYLVWLSFVALNFGAWLNKTMKR